MVLSAIAISACGQSDDRVRIRSVARDFVAAYAAGHGREACARLSAETVEALESQVQQDCSEAVTELQLQEGAVTHIDVFITNAKVDLASGESMFLSEQSEGWRLSAVGCRPTGGKPTNRPFECELEA